MTDAAYYRELLRPLIAGRRFVLCGGPLVAATGTVRLLLDLGARPPIFVICDVVGVGPTPEPEQAQWFCVDVRTPSTIGTIRAFEQTLVDPPQELVEALDAWDPARSALVLGSPFALEPQLAGRARYGARPPSWAALEDKTKIGEVLEAAGIPLAPSLVVPAERSPLEDVTATLDRGDGVVWAGDTASGHSGFAEYTRWVRTIEDAASALAHLGQECRRVRVMPFLEGVPCSIHGVVFPDTVAAFRPVEMLTLRDPAAARFHFCGSATYWDPPEQDREQMREAARRVGAVLRERVGYRGAFTLDGILTESGFRPTELNARFGGGLSVLAGSLPTLPLVPVDHAVRAGEPLDYHPDHLEALIVQAADAQRRGTAYVSTADRRAGSERRLLRHDGVRYTLVYDDGEADLAVELGGFSRGTHVRVVPFPERTPTGPPFAPRAAQAFAVVDELFGTTIGTLEAAEPVR
jgi:hypothetical protein